MTSPNLRVRTSMFGTLPVPCRLSAESLRTLNRRVRTELARAPSCARAARAAERSERGVGRASPDGGEGRSPSLEFKEIDETRPRDLGARGERRLERGLRLGEARDHRHEVGVLRLGER